MPVLFTAASELVRTSGSFSTAGGEALASAGVTVGRAWNEEFEVLVADDDTIHARHTSGELTPVNRDLECFLVFLVAALDAMRRQDPDALADGWWWPGIVDEFRLV